MKHLRRIIFNALSVFSLAICVFLIITTIQNRREMESYLLNLAPSSIIYGSLARRLLPEPPAWLSATRDWPLPFPKDWLSLVNRPQCDKELEALQTSVKRGRPYGDERWLAQTARALKLESTLNPRGRPRRAEVPK